MQMNNQDAFRKVEDLIGAILEKMEGISKPVKKFMMHLYPLMMGLRGRYNFLNLARYGKYGEQSYRNHFENEFDHLRFNVELVRAHCSDEIVLAFDPSYIPKSGKHTPNKGVFWSGTAQRAKPGLEIGCLATVDVKNNTAFSLEAISTPNPKELKKEGKTLIDHYSKQIISRRAELESISKYLTVDGYFAKETFIAPILENTDMEIISKLRNDANLKYLYHGKQKSGRGRKKQFDKKIDLKKIDKRRFTLCCQEEEVKVYECIVQSVILKRQIKVVYLEHQKNGKPSGQYAVLFSTDVKLTGEKIYRYYKSRFQIEFLIRDAKQYTGLEHCQARSEQKLEFHFNTSLTTIGIAKAIYYLDIPKDKRDSFSMYDIKLMFFNKMMTDAIFSKLEIDLSCKKIKRIYDQCLSFGRWAA
jgi:hypothetical protein